MKKTLRIILLSILVLLVLIFIYLPVAWLVISSVSTRSELLSTPIHWIPQQPTLQNYTNILFPAQGTSEVAKTFRITLWNSLLVASSVTIIALVLGSLASYALVRLRFPFQRSMLIGILGTRMIPEISLIIPLYLFATRFGLFNSPSILIITYLSFALPFAIWLMAAFFDTIPVELEDAARIDGCSRLETLWKIIMPISAPGLVSTGLFVFLTAWDEFFFALILTSTVSAKTVPVAIAEFTGRYVVDVGGMMTGGVLAAIPPVILSLIFQRYIVSGLTAGAVKG
ncbi:MAG TPA: carbohydrate ABC transporter permease [Anaerolineales bacterium]|nr:carbohydrate ABC transporter permease [Anaerolineales bacterium]